MAREASTADATGRMDRMDRMDRTGVVASAAGAAGADSVEAEADLTAVVATSMAMMEGSESIKRPLFRLACLWQETVSKVTSFVWQVLPAAPAASSSPS